MNADQDAPARGAQDDVTKLPKKFLRRRNIATLCAFDGHSEGQPIPAVPSQKGAFDVRL
jgi:hypothetical protein